METISKNHVHITAQISGLVGMLRPDHRAFPLLAAAAPNARFTVVHQGSYSDGPVVLARIANNPAVDALIARDQLVLEDGQVSLDSDDNASFIVRVSDMNGSVLVSQRFDAHSSPEAEVHSTLFAGDEGARVAIAKRFLGLLEKARKADVAANAALVAAAEAVF
jgi:hypothetical protein